ncbi:hypothetical protein ASPACDRAFT_45474 [Aspergillus aculeatus ATCC 16872]|uniref:Uncharacterized protein n=1 Tax=Aspergillus aculeatus (strain ATCC 16872 / CBS 172.66 / WB 5094) TaxID=690307 RepID=A0A1L9WMN9_ASPA1|nr:uncharacterized protein ASPACDRAFT_45474 [Aspergillus aculeatus ATCC 16872]OJJ97387.1 hypothetical protein ASPACDRAFT_45474 [Aspergillus aculeatus ATCC 16872]
MEVTKTATFGLAPVAIEPLGSFYLAALTEIQQTYNRLPAIAELDLRFTPISGQSEMTGECLVFPFLLSATERTTLDQRKLGFANVVHALSTQTLFVGMSLEVKIVFKL